MSKEKLFKKMYDAVDNQEAKILTIDNAKVLKGRKISTIYFGYNGQDGVDEFIIGDILSEFDLALRETSFRKSDPRYNNRAEYWESFMTKDQLLEMKNTLVLLTKEGRNTYIRSHSFNLGDFTCSDSDRHVYYMISDED